MRNKSQQARACGARRPSAPPAARTHRTPSNEPYVSPTLSCIPKTTKKPNSVPLYLSRKRSGSIDYSLGRQVSRPSLPLDTARHMF
ncbi:hypothetical protein EVAR_33942_1 [Eumeta japonica]|uniref:Uncharacterized protein n=1 Tax=Eumeta variegata TaxID=151549 RepID=A0A4C1VZS2_EUMVA|nr:hypothetical protein EVAR_33942_1 [Eumeta japonica]